MFIGPLFIIANWTSLVVYWFRLHVHGKGHMGIFVPNQGLDPHHLQQKHIALTTGLPGKSLGNIF